MSLSAFSRRRKIRKILKKLPKFFFIVALFAGISYYLIYNTGSKDLQTNKTENTHITIPENLSKSVAPPNRNTVSNDLQKSVTTATLTEPIQKSDSLSSAVISTTEKSQQSSKKNEESPSTQPDINHSNTPIVVGLPLPHSGLKEWDEDAIMKELVTINSPTELIKTLRKYNKLDQVLSYGPKSVFISNEGNYVFVFDQKIYGVYKNTGDSLIIVDAKESYDAVRSRGNLKEVWVDFVDQDTMINK